MNWKGWKLTGNGKALYTKINTGLTKLLLTKMAIGNGTPPSDYDTCTGLNNLVVNVPIVQVNMENDTINPENSSITVIEGELDTALLSSPLVASEWGVYATDPDLGEILLAINTDDDPTTIQPGGTYPKMKVVLITRVIDDTIFATKIEVNDLKNQMDDMKNNPSTPITSVTGYSQVTKMNTEALRDVYIPIVAVDTYCYPPIEVLKLYDDNISETYTVCDFINDDKKDFSVNDEVIFTNVMKLRSVREVPMTTPVPFKSGFISSTVNEIDLSDTSPYHHESGSTVEEVRIQ